jgi:hypothetical protein
MANDVRREEEIQLVVAEESPYPHEAPVQGNDADDHDQLPPLVPPHAQHQLHPTGTDAGLVSIKVQAVTGQEWLLRVRGSTTVAGVKVQIEAEQQIPPNEQRIMFGSAELCDDGVTLEAAGVTLVAAERDMPLLLLAMKEAGRPQADLAAAMDLHGLTEADQKLLVAEGVADLETLADLRDEDFVLSGIDIGARREDKLRVDMEAAAARHVEALRKQAESVLDEIDGLSISGRTVLHQQLTGAAGSLTLDALRELDVRSMGRLGLGMMDRKILAATLASVRVQRMRPVQAETVLTEPQRQETPGDAAQEARRRRARRQEQREMHWREAAAQEAERLSATAEVEPGPPSSLADVCERHGLTGEELELLVAEGLSTAGENN